MRIISRSNTLFSIFMATAAMCLNACVGKSEETRFSVIEPGAQYVAMGSSFAAGPGVGDPVTGAPERCGRSQANYAQQLAQKLNLNLTDVSCGGAKIEDILTSSSELPAQIEAIGEQTRLVTVTIGGNDLNYMGSLFSVYCRSKPELTDPDCNPAPPPTQDAYLGVMQGLTTIAQEVRDRAPEARLIFVDYLTVLPEKSTCNLTPLNAQDAENSRTIALRLAKITAQVARDTGHEVLTASKMSRDHNACSNEPWMNGWPNPGPFSPASGMPSVVPYHPNMAGMTAIAEALDQRISQ